jgi:ribosomal small subunit protein bTHX
MGKGDKKSKRGKIIIGSYGVRRPRKKKHTNQPEEGKNAEMKESPIKKKTTEPKAKKKSETKKTDEGKSEQKAVTTSKKTAKLKGEIDNNITPETDSGEVIVDEKPAEKPEGEE